MEKKGTPSKVNWTVEEREVLVENCCHIAVASGKFNNSLSAVDKAAFWADVTDSVNSVSTTHRSSDQVKKKWVDIKSRTMKKTLSHINDMKKTDGGGPAPVLDMLPWESKVLQAIPTCCVHGIEGGVDIFDDNLEAVEYVGTNSDLIITPLKRKSMSMSHHNIGSLEKRAKIESTDDANNPRKLYEMKSKLNKQPETDHDIKELVIEQTSVLKDLVVTMKTLISTIGDLKYTIEHQMENK